MLSKIMHKADPYYPTLIGKKVTLDFSKDNTLIPNLESTNAARMSNNSTTYVENSYVPFPGTPCKIIGMLHDQNETYYCVKTTNAKSIGFSLSPGWGSQVWVKLSQIKFIGGG